MNLAMYCEYLFSNQSFCKHFRLYINPGYSTSTGGISLRGHCKGVTDVLFSKHNPLLVSVSKDKTMRVWKATNYLCGAVYRYN